MMNKNSTITLSEGAGGKESWELFQKFKKELALTTKWKGKDEDGAYLRKGKSFLVFTTDSYTIEPLFFPGGDIGSLSICGTINDLAVMGAKPLAISLSFIIEEGFSKEILFKILKSIKKISKKYKTPIVTGDTKVVPKNKIDKIAINTAGIGLTDKIISNSDLREGDDILISGGVGEHALTILAERFNFKTNLKSDLKPILLEIQSVKKYIHAAKDPTRGGLASALNELAEKSKVKIVIEENKLPVKKEVKSLAEILGFDIFSMASEGIFICGAPPQKSQRVLKILKKFNKQAQIIGKAEKGRKVFVKTSIGIRKLEAPRGRLVPRIC